MINVLKIGGGAGIEAGAALRDLAGRVALGERWVLVHGASDAANKLGEQQGYPARTLVTAGGHTSRYNDPRTIGIFCQAAAAVNNGIVAELNALGIPAVGFADAEIVRATRKTAIRALVNGRQVIVRDDYSGTITGIDTARLLAAFEAGQVPVVAPVALGAEGERLNVDGDLVAAEIVRALAGGTLIILSNVPGLLREVGDPSSLVTGFDASELPRYEPLAAGRMKKKLMAAERADVARVILADARVDAPISAALAGAGTHITRAGVGHVELAT